MNAVPIELGPMPHHSQLNSELEVFELMIAGYVGSIVRAAKATPADKWNWSFSERTPTARETCELRLSGFGATVNS